MSLNVGSGTELGLVILPAQYVKLVGRPRRGLHMQSVSTPFFKGSGERLTFAGPLLIPVAFTRAARHWPLFRTQALCRCWEQSMFHVKQRGEVPVQASPRREVSRGTSPVL